MTKSLLFFFFSVFLFLSASFQTISDSKVFSDMFNLFFYTVSFCLFFFSFLVLSLVAFDLNLSLKSLMRESIDSVTALIVRYLIVLFCFEDFRKSESFLKYLTERHI